MRPLRPIDRFGEFEQDLGWLSHEQREAMAQQNSPAGGPSSAAIGPGGDGNAGSGNRSQGQAGRVTGGGGGRGKVATPSKRDRDGGRGGADGGAQQQQPAFRGYDFSQAPPSMGAFQREVSGGGARGGAGGGGGGVFNPFLAAGAPGAGPPGAAGGRGGGPAGPGQGVSSLPRCWVVRIRWVFGIGCFVFVWWLALSLSSVLS